MSSRSVCAKCGRPLGQPAAGELCPSCAEPPTRLDGRRGAGVPAEAVAPVGPISSPSTVDPYPSTVSGAGLPFDDRASTLDHRPGKSSREEGADARMPAGYEFLALLGQGGMGVVYKAWERGPERVVALKRVRFATDPFARERFKVEARALTRLRHPNIVQVLAVELDGPDPFFSMEFVDGGSLDQWVGADPPPSPAKVAAVIEAVARAVHAAHEAGVVHRDLKPGNILMTASPADRAADREETSDVLVAVAAFPTPYPASIPKVTDFGVAKRLDREDGLTGTDAVLGTPSFMAPEQADRRYGEVGARADVYALGATLYALLTGRPPFRGRDALETVQQLLADTPLPPRRRRPEIPPDLEAVCLKCLEKSPGARYASAAALADDLARWLAGKPTVARPLGWAGRAWRTARRWPAPVVGMAAIVLAATGAVTVAILASSGEAAPIPRDRAVPAAAPADPLAAIRGKLAAGEAVDLLGQAGPAWHDWKFTPSTLAKSPLADGGWLFQSVETTLLELLPDPGVARYRLSAEIRQLRRVAPNVGGRMDSVGLYFGADTPPAVNGQIVTTLISANFQDVDRTPPGGPPLPNEVRIDGTVILQTLQDLPVHSPNTVASVPFDPAPVWPGEWRQMVADVDPDFVRISWRDKFAKPLQAVKVWRGTEMNKWYASFERTRALMAPGSTFDGSPSWHPRRSMGIWCHQSSVAIRNVIVGPIPP